MQILIDLLREQALENLDVDGEDRLRLHREILSRKPLLKKVFQEFHHQFNGLDQRFLSGEGLRVELGAGVAPIRESFPDVLATDLVPAPYLDQVVNAEAMPFDAGSVRAIFGQNCFHHFPHPRDFFSELERVLVPGGGSILIEPYYGWAAGILYQRLFKSEGFDKEFPAWETPASGPMNGANQALSFIIFERDRQVFEREFLSLHIVHQKPLKNYLKYLLSGGLNFKQLSPNFLESPLTALETLISPLNRLLALHHVVVLRKST